MIMKCLYDIRFGFGKCISKSFLTVINWIWKGKGFCKVKFCISKGCKNNSQKNQIQQCEGYSSKIDGMQSYTYIYSK